MTRSQIERVSGGKERVRDGLVYSEFKFRNSDTLRLMKEELDLMDVLV